MIIKSGNECSTNKVFMKSDLSPVEEIEYYQIKNSSIFKPIGVKGASNKGEDNRN